MKYQVTKYKMTTEHNITFITNNNTAFDPRPI